MNKQFSKTESGGHYYWLDLLRFIAAFAVMACHFRGAFFEEYSNLPTSEHNPLTFSFYFITRLGFEAVLVFFVLSGFLVGGKAITRIADGTFKVRDYAIDRFVRIMLPLVSSLLFYLPICIFFDIPIVVTDWLGSLFSLQGILTQSAFATLWSLSYEVWFYILMFSIGIVWTYNKKSITIGIVLLILCMLVFCKLKVSYLFVWLFGAIVFSKLKFADTSKNRILSIGAFIVSMFLIVLLQISSGSRYLESTLVSNSEIFRDILIILFGLTFSIFVRIIIEIIPHKRWVIKLNMIGTKLAAFSYTLYLTHAPVLRLLEHLGAPKSTSVNAVSLVLYVCWLAIGMIVAYVLYYIFEKNTPLVKRFLKSFLLK